MKIIHVEIEDKKQVKCLKRYMDLVKFGFVNAAKIRTRGVREPRKIIEEINDKINSTLYSFRGVLGDTIFSFGQIGLKWVYEKRNGRAIETLKLNENASLERYGNRIRIIIKLGDK